MYQNEKEEAIRLQEVTWAPPRNLTKCPDWEEARKLENGEWRLEPEVEAEVPEIIIVSDTVEGTPVDLDGESRHEHVEAKLSRRGREMLNEDEEIRSPKRKVIRVESEESQDYVRDERSAKASVVNRQCSEKTLSYWQLASAVVNEGDEAYTTNLCQMCFNNTLAGKRRRTTNK